MFRQENKNLLTAYGITLGIAAFLIVMIVNFNQWFFPDDEIKLSEFTPPSRGVIRERDLRFGLFNDERFQALEPILSEEELRRLEEEAAAEPTTGTASPSVRPSREVRRGNPFTPF